MLALCGVAALVSVSLSIRNDTSNGGVPSETSSIHLVTTPILSAWNAPVPDAVIAYHDDLALRAELELGFAVASVVEAFEEWAAVAWKPAPVYQAPARVGGTVGECTGFAIPDYIIQRESGGNPSAYNPSGAYGCAQTLLSHYSRGQCQGLDPYTIAGQRECVWRLSNGGTNLQPWAATR